MQIILENKGVKFRYMTLNRVWEIAVFVGVRFYVARIYFNRNK